MVIKLNSLDYLIDNVPSVWHLCENTLVCNFLFVLCNHSITFKLIGPICYVMFVREIDINEFFLNHFSGKHR